MSALDAYSSKEEQSQRPVEDQSLMPLGSKEMAQGA